MQRIGIIVMLLLALTGGVMAGTLAPSVLVKHGAVAVTTEPRVELGAAAYYQWMLQCITGLEQDLPQITASAEAAARKYVQEDFDISAFGDAALWSEALGRSGGMIQLKPPWESDKPGFKGIMLYAIQEDRQTKELAQVAAYHQEGRMVIAFGRKEMLQRAQDAGAQFDAVVDTHAAVHGGLFYDAQQGWIVPTDPTANVIALWVWTGEFVSACTRLGKMPTMYLGYAVPGGKAWADKIRNLKFHEGAPAQVGAGKLGLAYLRAMRHDLAGFYAQERRRITTVAQQAVQARTSGHAVYTFLHGHPILRQLPCAHDTGYFTQMNNDWFSVKKTISLQTGDYVFGVGFDTIFRGKEWDNMAERARAAGAKLAWSITGYLKEQVAAVPPDEILIDQHWGFGDAVVTVPGYEIKILPTGGTLAEAVLWMVNADMFRMLHEAK